ncbi:uncharacterized protein [Nicotiana tomentosiformis]|uniref:uncharacterized protein n=1 Tax=Nicotiana tomentosiformis TaxID=4098 RepID=UPI00388C9A22
MDTIYIIVAFNGRWTADYKYLDHQTKVVLVSEAIRFEDFVNQVFEVIELDRGKFEAMIWFDINLGTSKGMLVSKDLDLHTCIELLKSHSLFKGCRLIIDVSERVFGSTSTFEHVNLETQHDNQDKCQQIMEIDVVEPKPIIEEVLQTFNSIQVEGQSIIEIDNQQALGIQVLESAPIIEEVAENSSTQLTRQRSKSKQKESPSTILRENASLDEIKMGSIFDKKNSIINYFSNIAIKEHFEFRVIRLSSTRYSLKCNDEKYGWCVRAFRIKDLTLFKIVKIEKTHDCSVNTMKADQRHATSKLISGYIIDNLRYPRFLYMFYAYGSAIAGWNHCRPVIAVYGTILKSKYRGILMISVSMDSNNQIFPLAFGIAESKNNNSYEWYFSELHNAIGNRDNLIFLLDMHQSIAHGIAKVFPVDSCVLELRKKEILSWWT